MTIEELKKKADYIRDEVIRVACKNKCGHIAPSLSTVDILVALYYKIMFPFANTPLPDSRWEERDRLVLSKGHGCYALYAILADLGILPQARWENFGFDGWLKGCVEYFPEWGLEAGTGSLGHGLPMAVGMAYAAKLQKLPWHTYCIVGDGELQEGSCWESMHFLNENGIDNITVIVDLNGFKALESTSNLAENFTDWIYCDGHDMKDIIDRLSGKYLTVIAKTIKGKGLKCMEGISKFHYRVPDEAEICEGKTYGQE